VISFPDNKSSVNYWYSAQGQKAKGKGEYDEMLYDEVFDDDEEYGDAVEDKREDEEDKEAEVRICLYI
jgi:hypothetical protein